MSEQPVRKHGSTQFYIQGEGFAPAAMLSPRLRRLIPEVAAAL